MLNSIRINGFRKYKSMELNEFGRVNFVLGNNNVGKTSVLEAIFAWACGQNISPFLNIPLARARYSNIQAPYWIMEEILSVVNDHRSIPFRMSLSGNYDGKDISFEHAIYPSELLGEYDSSYKRSDDGIRPRSNGGGQELTPMLTGIGGLMQYAQPVIIAKWEVKHNGKKVSDNITVPSTLVSQRTPYKMTKFIDLLSHIAIQENVQMYSSLKRENKLDEVTEEIRKIFPEVKGFDTIPYPDGSQAPISIVKQDGSILPMYACGDGLQRWFYILGSIYLYKNSIICIDEIDTGLHPDAQYEFSKNLVQYAQNNNVQLFITTHNIEFIDKFLDANQDLGGEFLKAARIITLRDDDGTVRTRTLDAVRAAKAREEYKTELR